MSERYPRLRWVLPNDDSPHGPLILRDGVLLSFFMRRPHHEIGQAVEHVLELYLDTVGRDKLGWILESCEGIDLEKYKGWCPDMVPLDERYWTSVREDLRSSGGCSLALEGLPHEAGGFRFAYQGKTPEGLHGSDFVSQVSFWLPTEYLESQGPARVKALATEMARALPFNSGYVSLGLNALGLIDPVLPFIREQGLRHPGLDLPFLEHPTISLGTHVHGTYWLNFYSQPLLGALGGARGLEARLAMEGVSVEELSPQKVLVALGEWPDLGDPQHPGTMAPYRALARVLEPHLIEKDTSTRSFSQEQIQRWRRRFLD